MKLIYRIALRLSLVLLPLMALWAALFYYTMVGEINDEADDALEDYSTLIISRMLAGRELPSLNSGSNNSYSITPVDASYADTHPHIDYYDADIFIPEKDETEPARVLVTIFTDRDGLFYELKVATPTFEKDDLLDRINRASAGILAEYALARPELIAFCIGFGSVFRKLERTGDHLTNIAEEIVFYIDAKVIKHGEAGTGA